jgi:hypothetical protein
MKTKSFLVICLLALAGAIAVPVVHADDSAPQKEKKVSKAALKKYDTDNDGKLSAEEEAARKADREKAKAERKAKKEAKEAAQSQN